MVVQTKQYPDSEYSNLPIRRLSCVQINFSLIDFLLLLNFGIQKFLKIVFR